MSVAEKPITEAPARSPAAQLAVQSLVGGVFVLASFWILLAGLPLAWSWITNSDDPDRSRHLFNEFLNGSLLLIVTAGAVVGLGYVGLELERANNRRGLREGAFVASFFLYIAARITLGIGLVLSRQEMGVAGMVVTLAIGAGFLFGLYKWFSLPGFAAWLGRLKDSGWFETNVFKGSQGVKIRRMTVIAILILGFWGIITMVRQGVLGTDRPGAPNNWEIGIPFTGAEDAPNTLPLMFHTHLVLPIVLGAVLIWFAWRVVNLPTFADFLIATEAEMNKVSWTTRARLFQDTIVVLVTMIIMTVFLFVVDILWIQILSNEWISVLQVDTRAEKAKLEEKARW
ncbi:MAG: preprotein translocase subunit SecE [Gemmataceae bacterium]